jgi:hypothetical protein
VWLILAASASLLGCKEEVIVSGADALADPRVAPKITFSNPPLNSTGPYIGWNAADQQTYHLLFRFNKLMDFSSIVQGFRVTSSKRPVFLNYFDNDDTQMKEAVLITLRDDGWWSFAPPQIGEVLTVRLERPVADVNGNLLPAGLLGTIIPEPLFRVAGTYPMQGDSLGDAADIILTFNSKVDTSIRRYITTTPPARGRWEVGYDSLRVYLYTSDLPAATAYSVTVAAGAHDIEGHLLPAPFSVTYPSVSFHLVVPPSPPEMLGTELYRRYELRMSLPVDAPTLAGAFHVTPDVESDLSLGAFFSEIAVTPLVDFAPLTRYTMTIDTSLRALNGMHLDRPVSWSFTTGPFRVLGTTPGDGAAGVSPYNDLGITFSGRLDTATVRRAFSIVPPVAGMLFPTAADPRIVFYLADSLKMRTTYTVTIDSTLRSARGARLDAPYTFTFTTGGL